MVNKFKIYVQLLLLQLSGFVLAGTMINDYQNYHIINLCPVFKNEKFMEDFVFSYSLAAQRSLCPTFCIFRIDGQPEGSSYLQDSDFQSLNIALQKHPLPNSPVIVSNDKNEGCSNTRKTLYYHDLPLVIESNPDMATSITLGRLLIQFLDTDDVLHSDLFTVQLNALIKTPEATVLSFENCSRMFNGATRSRMSEMNSPRNLEDFRIAPESSTCEQKPKVSPDGRMMTSKVRGYPPFIFRYKEFDPEYLDGHSEFFDTMTTLWNTFPPDSRLMVYPTKTQASLYFYRQHGGSILHSKREIEEILSPPSVKKWTKKPERKALNTTALADSDPAIVKTLIAECITSCPDLGEALNSLLITLESFWQTPLSAYPPGPIIDGHEFGL
jgi:hypothetical protein